MGFERDSDAGRVSEKAFGKFVRLTEPETVRDLMANRSRLPLSSSLEFSDFEGEDDNVLSRLAAEVAKGEETSKFWSYTNVGWCMLGRAIECVTGLTWEDAMRKSVFAPLGMEQTTFSTWPTLEPGASGH